MDSVAELNGQYSSHITDHHDGQVGDKYEGHHSSAEYVSPQQQVFFDQGKLICNVSIMIVISGAYGS